MAGIIRILRIIFILFILAAVITLAVSNRAVLSFSLYPLPYEISMPVFLLLFIVFFAGATFGMLLMLRRQWQLKRQLKSQKQALDMAKFQPSTISKP